MQLFQTLSEAITALQSEGYTTDFNLQANSLLCNNKELELQQDEFHVDKFFRFDDNEDPGDQSILYAISSEKHQLKGLLVNAYGIYGEDISDQMMKKLTLHG